MHKEPLIQPGEEVIVVVRKHWSVLASSFLAAIAVIVIPLSFPLLGTTLDPFLLKLFWYFYTIALLLLWVSMGYTVADYLLDAWVITNRRIIDVEQNGFFYRRVTTVSLNKIQNIVVEVSGMHQAMFNTGMVIVETAAERTACIIPDVPYPDEVKQIILDAAEQVHN